MDDKKLADRVVEGYKNGNKHFVRLHVGILVSEVESLRQQLDYANLECDGLRAKLDEYRAFGTVGEIVKQFGYQDLERDRLRTELETARAHLLEFLDIVDILVAVDSVAKKRRDKEKRAVRQYLQPRQPDAA